MITRILISALLCLTCSCAYRGPDGTIADLGRDAGVVYARDETGMYVVLDQNESRSFRDAMATIVTGLLANARIEIEKEETAQSAARIGGLNEAARIDATRELEVLKETNRSTEALAELEVLAQ